MLSKVIKTYQWAFIVPVDIMHRCIQLECCSVYFNFIPELRQTTTFIKETEIDQLLL